MVPANLGRAGPASAGSRAHGARCPFGALTWLDSRAANREQIEPATEANERERADWQREAAQQAAESTAVAEAPVRLSAEYSFWMGPKGYAFSDALLDLGGMPWDSTATPSVRISGFLTAEQRLGFCRTAGLCLQNSDLQGVMVL